MLLDNPFKPKTSPLPPLSHHIYKTKHPFLSTSIYLYYRPNSKSTLHSPSYSQKPITKKLFKKATSFIKKELTEFVFGITGHLPRSTIAEMETAIAEEAGLNLKATELRLGLPGTDESKKETVASLKNNKRPLPDTNEGCESKGSTDAKHGDCVAAPAAKAQVVGWPPIRNYRKNSFQPKKAEPETGIYVKVSMDGAPYLRKIDLKLYKGYSELLKALENMFKLTIGEYSEREGYKGSEFAPTYEDKDGDWMLVGDVPWEMFMTSCKRLRIMKASEARGLGCGV